MLWQSRATSANDRDVDEAANIPLPQPQYTGIAQTTGAAPNVAGSSSNSNHPLLLDTLLPPDLAAIPLISPSSNVDGINKNTV